MPKPTRRKSAKSTRPARAPKKGNQNSFLIGFLVLSLVALGVSLWFLQKERDDKFSTDSISEKARKLSIENPDAEVLAGPVDNAPSEKKK